VAVDNQRFRAAAMGMFNIIKMLSDANIEYVLVGGLAVALHGYQRVTMDVDVVLAMNQENIQRLIACAKAADLRPVIPVNIDALAQPELIEQWYNEKGMLAFGLRGSETMATVMDVLVKSVVPFSDLRRDATIIEIGALKVPVASIEHLIAMKTHTGRSKDVIDIEELRKIQAGKSP
jgi:predicted nucleotidyltransferase